LYWRSGFFPADQPAPPDYDYDVIGGIVNGAYAGTATGWYLWHEDIPDAAWGHVVLGNANALWDAETNGKLARLVSAYNGERAADRIQRLCDEEDLLLHITDSGLSARMGPQRTKGLLELLDECANAEDAIMYDSYGVAPNNYYNHVMWRSLGTLWNQAPKMTLDYEAGHISPPLDVIIDDRGAVNDMTIQQDGGTARKYVDMDGPAGVDAIGRYSASKTLNLYELAPLEPRAACEVRKGTVIEPRIGAVTVNVTINDELRYPCEQIYPGDFIEVVNLPRRVTPDPIKLMVVGVQEHITESMRLFTFITVPGSVYDMGHTWGNSATDMFARADLTDSTVATDGFVTGTDTALVVDVPTVPWTTDPADLPFDVRVAGAVLTVTDVSPVVDGQQGFIVSTTVKNGVVKELPVGARVQIEPGAYAANV